MATLTVAGKNAMLNSLVDLIDQGSTNSSGKLIFKTGSTSTVATLTLSNPAFGDASAGSVSANSITADTNAVGGTIATFSVVNRNETEIFSGTVTATGGGGDIELSTLSITSGDHVSLSTFALSM